MVSLDLLLLLLLLSYSYVRLAKHHAIYICTDDDTLCLFLFIVEKKTGVSFGTTLTREIYPTHVPHTRFGNDLKAIRGQPNTGPGCYNNEEVGVT